jgi:hypothetical protein
MHGQPNIKICSAKQERRIFQSKKVKIKLYKNNAAIWYNKICRIKQLTPNYINIRVNSNNTRSQKTKNTAIRYRINQEQKFLYIKKQQLNEQLYRIHLECAAHWPTTWNLIQATMDNNIHQEMETHYNRLNKKLNRPLQKQLKHSTPPQQNEDQQQFYTRVKNLTNIRLNAEEMQLLKYGLNYSIERPASTYAASLAAETEQAIRLLDTKLQNTYRFVAAKKLKQIINSTSQTNILQKRHLHVMKELNKKLTTGNAIVTQADKGKTTVIIDSKEYAEKVQSFLTTNNFNTLTKDPTNNFQKPINKTM